MAPLTPAALEGLQLGPVSATVDGERVGAFVAATGDDPARWVDVAPPGYAAALLFRVADEFLWDPALAEARRTLLHVDQTFAYRGPIRVGASLSIRGRIERVRARPPASFVEFVLEVLDGDVVVVDGTSTFLMSPEPAAEAGEDPGEPPFDLVASSATPTAPRTLGERDELDKSVSRWGILRYGAATGDLNPIHWDHEAARAAGLPGVVAHGLLLHAWMSQLAAAYSELDAPLAFVKTRFRAPLRPAVPARVVAELRELSSDGRDAAVALSVESEGRSLATAAATVRLHGERP
ncbi:MAG TPA: hypothetical protein ENK55_12410 [Actinobacteria bacterium]|nr:hypothetical protein [Actinomycetota bacterium]